VERKPRTSGSVRAIPAGFLPSIQPRCTSSRLLLSSRQTAAHFKCNFSATSAQLHKKRGAGGGEYWFVSLSPPCAWSAGCGQAGPALVILCVRHVRLLPISWLICRLDSPCSPSSWLSARFLVVDSPPSTKLLVFPVLLARPLNWKKVMRSAVSSAPWGLARWFLAVDLIPLGGGGSRSTPSSTGKCPEHEIP
jgi:hypothetical protein